nr:hypothetical protein [Tanacetum cinerariifolium]
LNITPTDTTVYVVPSFTSKVFANLRQYEGPSMPLLVAMLPQVAQTNPPEGPPIAPLADEPMPDPAHAPNAEEPISSPILEPKIDALEKELKATKKLNRDTMSVQTFVRNRSSKSTQGLDYSDVDFSSRDSVATDKSIPAEEVVPADKGVSAASSN